MDGEVAMRKRVGSPGYVAPEIIMHKPYNEKVACSNETHVRKKNNSADLVKIWIILNNSEYVQIVFPVHVTSWVDVFDI